MVHGSSDDAPEEIYKNRDLAIGYALDALRAIYKGMIFSRLRTRLNADEWYCSDDEDWRWH